MSQESTTPDLVEFARRRVDAADSRDIDAMMSFLAPDAVWDSTHMGLEVFEGSAAIRRFLEDWWGSYEASEVQAEEILDLGNGVGFAVVIFNARPAGSGGNVRWRYAVVSLVVDNAVSRETNYTDIDEARAAAERLAEERG